MDHFERTLRIINNAVHSIRENEFNALLKDCLETLKNGHKIVTSGLGKNVPICEKFVGSLNSLGIPAVAKGTDAGGAFVRCARRLLGEDVPIPPGKRPSFIRRFFCSDQ